MEARTMGARILIVDDDKDYLLAAKLMLEAESFNVATAESASQATKLLKKNRPSLILLDVKMPEKDGFTFCDELAANPEFSKIPVVLVTAVAENPGMMMYAFEKDYALNAAEILPKTAVEKDLVGAVRRCLGKKK
jgi:two-component system sensor histidine kinase/response regulator